MLKVDPDRLAEIEKAAGMLERKGWAIEKLAVVDENGEPLRFQLKMRYGPLRKDDVL